MLGKANRSKSFVRRKVLGHSLGTSVPIKKCSEMYDRSTHSMISATFKQDSNFISPVLYSKKSLSDELLLKKLSSKLFSSQSTEEKLKIIHEVWEEVLKPLKFTKVLNEIKNQLLKLIKEPSNFSVLEAGSQQARIEKLEQKLIAEKKHSQDIHKKLKTLSLENIELDKKQEENQHKLDYWISLSMKVSGKKRNYAKYEEILEECDSKDKTILDLSVRVSNFEENHQKLMKIITKQKRFISRGGAGIQFQDYSQVAKDASYASLNNYLEVPLDSESLNSAESRISTLQSPKDQLIS